MYLKVSLSDFPIGREKVESKKKPLLTATWVFCPTFSFRAQRLLKSIA
jgi:hypothetical protein